jgi:hypothetical protein
MSEPMYQDGDGNEVTLDVLCRKEPAWAANTIRQLRRRAEDAEAAHGDTKANSTWWRLAYNSWQDWAAELLDDLGRQPLGGQHGDGPARELIAQLAGQAAGVPRCSRCGCFASRHEVDDEELRGCADCECTAYQAPD